MMSKKKKDTAAYQNRLKLAHKRLGNTSNCLTHQSEALDPSPWPRPTTTTRGPGKWSGRFETAVVAQSGWSRLAVVV